MMEVVYVGSSDSRSLTRANFDSIGTDHKDMVFPKGEAVEVSNDCGQALLGHPAIAGEFIAYQDATKVEGLEDEPEVDTSAIVNLPSESVVEPDEEKPAKAPKKRTATSS